MPEAISPKQGFTRRSFLKGVGAAGALGLAGAAGMTAVDGWLAPASAYAGTEERVGYMYHQLHCGGSCPFKCTVRDGRLCLMEPNDANKDSRYRVCCLKGLSEIQHVYSAERIQTPLKLVGERGSGEYVSITWDEALDMLKEKLTGIWNEHGKNAVYVHTSGEAGQTMPFLAPMLGAQTGGWTGIDQGIGNGLDPAIGSSKGTSDTPGETGVGVGYAAITNDPRDMVNSDFIINIGSNFVETNLMQSARFFDAKEAGAHIVTVDPHFCTTAQKSNEWVPIEPGTDAALFLGMVSVVLDKKLYNTDFMVSRTGFPFLVSDEDGKLLRAGEGGGVDASGKAVDPGDFMVWDTASNAAVRHDAEGAQPALEGTYEIDGKSYTTVFSKLVEHQAPYTLSWASGLTKIPEEKIEELATRYATANAAGILTGWGGVDKMSNSDIDGHAIAMLVGLTGQIGRPGAFVGCPAEGSGTYGASLAGWKFPSGLKSVSAEKPPYLFYQGETKIRAYVAVGDTALQKMADMGKTVEWLKSLDFVCVMDMYHMTTCDYADLILPVSTKFEAEEDIARLMVYNGHVMLGGKVLEPLFESRSDFRIQKDIAEVLGIGDELPESNEAWIRYQLDKATDASLAGITVDSLMENGYVQELAPQADPKINYADRFGTASKKMQVYYDAFVDIDQELPTWEQNQEMFEGNPLKEKYPLQYCQVRTKYRLHNQFFDSSWINEIVEFRVELNPIDMKSRELETGDEVEVFNDRGTMKCKVSANESVRPGVLRVVEGVWDKQVEGGGYQFLTNGSMPERSSKLALGSSQPFNDTLCEVKKA